MKIERLPSKGGVRVSGSLADGDPFVITRLAIEGETRVSFPGMDLDYDTGGHLILAVVRLTEFATSQPVGQMAKLPAEFWETVNTLMRGGVEVAAEVDLVKGVVEILSLDRFGRKSLTTFILGYYVGAFEPVLVGDEDGLIGKVGFQVGKGEKENVFQLGVGSPERVMWVAAPLAVETELLSDKTGAAEVNAFLQGKIT